MAGIGKYLLPLPHFDDPPQVHDGGSVADISHDGQVVRDQHHPDPEPVAEVGEQGKDGGLDRHVERRNWLVGHDHLGFDGQGPGDGDALALAPGKGGGVAVEGVRGQADQGHQLLAAAFQRLALGQAVEDEELGQHRADGQAWVERGVRVLEDELDGPVLLTGAAGAQQLSAQRYRTGARAQQPGQATGHRGLPAPRLPDDAQGLALRHGEADILDRSEPLPFAGGEGDVEVLGRQQGQGRPFPLGRPAGRSGDLVAGGQVVQLGPSPGLTLPSPVQGTCTPCPGQRPRRPR